MQTNAQRALESLIHKQHTVLGRKLEPFCLWHMINLERIHSPFLRAKQQSPSRLDLMEAVAICCSLPEAEPVDMTPDESYLNGDFDIPFEIDKFRTYRRDYAAQFRCNDSKGEPLKMPWWLAVIARLMRYGKYSKREALVEHYGFAMNLCMALGEANGGSPPVMSAEQERTMVQAGWLLEDSDAG